MPQIKYFFLALKRAGSWFTTLSWSGCHGGRIWGDKQRPDPVSLWRGNNTMQGVFSPSSLDQEHERVFSMVEAILQNIAAGVLRVVIDRIFPLSEAAEAHRYVLGRNPFGRVLLQPEGRCQFYFSHLTG